MASPKTSAKKVLKMPIGRKKKASPNEHRTELGVFFENHPVPMWVYDLKSLAFLEVNDAATEKYGYSRAEFRKMTIKDIRPEEDVGRLLADVGQARPALQHSGDWRHRLKDGRVIDVEITSHTLKFNGRNAALVMAQDITERKRAEQALRDSEEKFSKIFYTSPFPISITRVSDGRYVDVNNSFLKRMGYQREEVIGRTALEIGAWADPTEREAMMRTMREQGILRNFETKFKTKSGEIGTALLTRETIELGGEKHYIGSTLDITERKRAEAALRENENHFRSLFNNMLEGYAYCKMIYEHDRPRDFIYLEINKAFENLTGLKNIIGKKVSELIPGIEKSNPELFEIYGRVATSGKPERFETYVGELKIWFSISVFSLEKGYFVAVFDNITERKQAEGEKEKLLRVLEASLNEIYVFDTNTLKFSYVNAATLHNIGYTFEEVKELTPVDLKPEFTQNTFREMVAPLLGGEKEVLAFQTVHRRKDGSLYLVEVHLQIVQTGLERVFLAVIHDITERKQAEEALHQAEEKYRSIFENATEAINQTTPEGRFITVNPAGAHMLGYESPAELIKDITDVQRQFYVKSDRRAEFIRFMDEHGTVEGFESEVYRRDGSTIWVSENSRAIRDDHGRLLYYEGSAVNITERKQTENIIRQHLTQLEMLYESGLALNQLLNPKEIARKVIDLMGEKLNWHHTTIRLYHPENESLELLAFNLPETMNKEDSMVTEERFKSLIGKAGVGLSGWAVQHRQAVRVADLTQDARYVETVPSLHSGLYIPMQIEDRIVGVISIESEKSEAFSEADERLTTTLANQAAIALENARLHEETLNQIRQLQSLRDIDLTITNSFNQDFTLDVLLSHAMKQLGIDAASIHLVQPYQPNLKYVAGKGFQGHTFETSEIKISGSFAGRAILERRIIHVNVSEIAGEHTLLSNIWSEEGFKSQHILPLIAKGEVKGVLNVFLRKDFTPSPTWLNFLETLAGQAAIAIENTQMFDGLQRSNMELAVAYDATIEGWSQAMDLRDKETEGHTQRVTRMATQLAKAMKFNDEEIVHVRRGGLLHDIGKLGVPDHILLKPDNLTDEEWRVMKKHPQFAYDMLSSISYLRRALDIPYCHHEKWDGTGYPRGLKGEQIPLAARIFAVIDVWDALTSDRPYRKAWTGSDALKHIREQSGKHFDPQVVDAFLDEFGNV